MSSPVERLHGEFEALIAHLEAEPSLRSTADDSFRKSLLLASTSFFESQLSQSVANFAEKASNSSDLIVGIITKKAIERNYHTWFDWDRNNANKFYSMFGKEFSEFMKVKHSSMAWLDDSVSSFMELGRARNLLVHENFATFVMEKTAAEIFVAHTKASRFVDEVPNLLLECNALSSRSIANESASTEMAHSLQELRLKTFCR
jgi:hypothetical protein